jgi:hypothetical protein
MTYTDFTNHDSALKPRVNKPSLQGDLLQQPKPDFCASPLQQLGHLLRISDLISNNSYHTMPNRLRPEDEFEAGTVA